MILLLILPLLVIAPYLGSVLIHPGSVFSDLLISHLPNAQYIRQAIDTWGQIPLWSGTILSGYPFYADPLSGLWYPPAWLAVWSPGPLALNVLFGLHLLLGGIGMYCWLRAEGLRPSSAILAGVLFEGMPILWSHFSAGHVSLIYAVCWTPWLLYSQARQRQPNVNRMVRFTPGLILAVIFLADPRWIIYAGPLWLAYLVYRNWPQGFRRTSGLWPSIKAWLAGWDPRLAGEVAVNSAVAGLVAAPLLIPLAGYTGLSTRASMSAAETGVYSLKPAELLQLFTPNPTGSVETIFYPTMLGLFCLALCLCSTRLRRTTAFWLGLAGISLVLALGANLPVIRELGRLPVLNLVRAPSRSLFLLGISVCVLSATTLEALTSASPVEFRIGRLKPPVALIGILEIVLMISVWIAWIDPEKRLIVLWSAAWGLLVVVALVLRLSNRLSAGLLGGIFLLAAVLEPAWINRSTFEPQSQVRQARKTARVTGYLRAQGGAFRTYSPSYSLEQDTAVMERLQMADGVDPLQLAAYRDFMETASGVPSTGYSVTLPAFANGDPQVDNRAARPDAHLLGWLNVRYLLAEYPVDSPGLVLMARFDDTRVYKNIDAYPRAWLQADQDTVASEIQPVDAMHWSPNQITVWVNGPGRLVLSELDYPGWSATIDGSPAAILPVNGLLRSVNLGAGTHQVIFSFHPQDLTIGLWCAGVTLLLWLGFWLRSLRLERRSRLA